MPGLVAPLRRLPAPLLLRLGVVVGLALGLGLAAPARAAVTLGEMSMLVGEATKTHSFFYSGDANIVRAPCAAGQPCTVETHFVGGTIDEHSFMRGSDHALASATADKGAITFDSQGFVSADVDAYPFHGIEADADLFVSFTTDAAAILDYDFLSMGDGGLDGAGDYVLSLVDDLGVRRVLAHGDGYGPGATSEAFAGAATLEANRTYGLEIILGDFTELHGAGQKSNHVSSTFNWRILPVSTSAVPEPANWALMMSGLGLAGAALRRRRAMPA